MAIYAIHVQQLLYQQYVGYHGGESLTAVLVSRARPIHRPADLIGRL